MKAENLSQYTDDELSKKLMDIKSNKIINAFIIGITVGIFVYGATKHGLGIASILPLIIGYQIYKSSTSDKIIEQEINRELQKRRNKA